MRRWFARLPIHRKLIVTALVVTTAALTLAVSGLVAVDLWRYRAAAVADTVALAQVVAENSAAAVLFNDPDDARQSLASLRVRPNVRRACLYLQAGDLFAAFEPVPAFGCGTTMPVPASWTTVAGTGTVRRNGTDVGTVYVERELTDVGTRVGVAVLSGAVMLLLAGVVAFAIAVRLARTVSMPIAQLAAAARTVHPERQEIVLPPIAAGIDEIGDLVRAFSDMVRRIQEASDALRRKEAEREELLTREREASRLKDEFLAAVSHELRTPLNAIMGWAQILSTTSVSEPTTARAIASIARNAKAQTRVIEDLVDVSRIVTGKLTLRFDPVDLREPVEGALDVTRPAAQAKQITLDARLLPHPCLVNGDRDRLQQVIWNLLSNAVKFTPSGGVITVTMRATGPLYEVEVTDTGTGIPREFLPFVFERFRQADGSMTREHGGLGLGLAIVKEITGLHGGSADAESAGPGRGSTFRVRLPALLRLGDTPPDVAAEEGSAPAPTLAGVRVLAVDDNADALEILAVSLRDAGADVETVTSGAAALRAWREQPPDILLCDLAMPGTDGFELLRQVRTIDAAAGRVTPAIAVTAHATDDHVARSIEAGFVQHVAKPYRPRELVRIVSDALARS